MKNLLLSAVAVLGLAVYQSASTACIFLFFDEPEFPA